MQERTHFFVLLFRNTTIISWCLRQSMDYYKPNFVRDHIFEKVHQYGWAGMAVMNHTLYRHCVPQPMTFSIQVRWPSRQADLPSPMTHLLTLWLKAFWPLLYLCSKLLANSSAPRHFPEELQLPSDSLTSFVQFLDNLVPISISEKGVCQSDRVALSPDLFICSYKQLIG